MREPRGSLLDTTVAKLRREGVLSMLREAPGWVVRNVATEARLTATQWRRRVRYRQMGLRAVPDPEATIDVDPASIAHVVPLSRFKESSPRALLGTVRDGDWDIGLSRVEAQLKYQACRERVEEGHSWEETGIVDHLAAELAASDADAIEHGCDSRAALLARYEGEREALYLSLREEGYDRETSPVCCRIHISRTGHLLFGSGGRHRFYLSRLLGVDAVPVQVLCRHREWQTVREAFAAADTAEDLSVGVRRHLGHPDLREFALPRESSHDGPNDPLTAG